MKTNISPRRGALRTHEGGPAKAITPEAALRRSVLSCMLWEREFYEDGEDIATRIGQLANQVSAETLGWLAVEARTTFNLRHAPLLLTAYLAARGGSIVSWTLGEVIQRADELAEFLAIYAKVNGVSPSALKPKLSNQVRKGLARAFGKFDEYGLAKYDRAGAVRLRDALFLCHAKPADDAQAALWKRLVGGELATPETWEVRLSGGGDKKAVFEGLIREGKLGYLALLRNLRNMEQAGCDKTLVRDAILARKGAHRVLPFRYVAAARAAPMFEPAIDQALSEAIAGMKVLSGSTAVLVDVSGSMTGSRLSARSEMSRADAAAAIGALINGDVRMFAFGTNCAEVPARRGMAGVDAIRSANVGHGTEIGKAVRFAEARGTFDRMIVITDEQSNDAVADPAAPRAYVINVASARNGVGYGRWTHIDGFSEAVLRYIDEIEHDERPDA